MFSKSRRRAEASESVYMREMVKGAELHMVPILLYLILIPMNPKIVNIYVMESFRRSYMSIYVIKFNLSTENGVAIFIKDQGNI